MRNALRNQPLNSSLILINQEDYKIYGNFTITGKLIVINSKLTITGNLKIVKNENLNDQVFISRSKVFTGSISSEVDIIAEHDTIRAQYGLNCPNIYGNVNLSSNGTINIRYNSHVGRVVSRNYTVGGNNHSREVICSNSITIMGDSKSKAMHAERLHIEGDSDFSGTSISVDLFTSNGHVRNCYRNFKP
ncbi:MAG: hypothetical protein HFJ41_00560 [Clostridia bacterium]|nr:hypothetical protein [Clostridia bacterium]